MRMVRPNEADTEFLKPIADDLKRGNAMLAVGKKIAETAKENLAKWLKDHRSIDLESLSIGDMVLIEEILLLEISKQNKFDESAFAAANPKQWEEFKRDFAIRKFKAI